MSLMSSLSTIQADYSTSGLSSASNAMDSDDFMLLLLAQLTNQNPMEPMDDNELMTQFTQLNSLQELQNISATLSELLTSESLLKASSLIGKQIEAYDTSGEIISGEVTGVSFDQGQIMLTLGDQEIPLDNLLSVASVESEE